MLDTTEILEILNDWNYWHKAPPLTIKRDFYDKKISNFIEKDEILVIKGVRRCGKSFLMINQIKKLLSQGVNPNEILFINLEDPRFLNHLNIDLLHNIKDVYLENLDPKSKPYIFLDEIQNIPYWEKWVNKEYELKLSYTTITGSNSSLLSSEISSALSGRYISVEVFPLSFKEYLDFKGMKISSKLEMAAKKIELNRELNNYLKDGGFPKLISYNNRDKKELLITYKDSILLKDIVARFKLKNFTILEDISAFLLANSGIVQSITKLKNNFSISYDMASDYIGYLKKAYMIYEVAKFNYSLKKQRVNEKKYYSIDLGLSNLMRVPNKEFIGADLETIVFSELIRRGYIVYYYKTSNDLEMDFVVEDENEIVQLIQVSKTLSNKKTLEREIKPFEKITSELNLKNVKNIIITKDNTSLIKSDTNSNNIFIINIKEWLLGL